jgi:uncharacterized membrane protein
MEERPKIEIKFNTADKLLEIIGWITLALQWIMTILNYSNLPDTIPIHFNASGQADDFGSKWYIFTLPIIGTVIFLGITILNKFPHIFNYPSTITKDNAEKQYKNALRMMIYLKFVIVFTFIIIQYKTIQTAFGNSQGLGVWFLPLSMGLILIPTIFFVIKAVKTK